MPRPTTCQAIESALPRRMLRGPSQLLRILERTLLAAAALFLITSCDGTGRLFAPSVEHYIGHAWEGEVVVLSGLRPCAPTQAYERPLLVQVVDESGEELFRVPHSGIPFDDQRTFLPLYFNPSRNAPPTGESTGKREIRVWECAPLLDAVPPTYGTTSGSAPPCHDGRRVRTIRIPGYRPDGKPTRRVYDIGLRASRCLERISPP